MLTEVKIMNDKYPRCASGFKLIMLKATSHSQGGIALLWNKGHASFEIEAAKNCHPEPLVLPTHYGVRMILRDGDIHPP